MRPMGIPSAADACKCWAAISNVKSLLWSNSDCWYLWVMKRRCTYESSVDCCRAQSPDWWSRTTHRTGKKKVEKWWENLKNKPRDLVINLRLLKRMTAFSELSKGRVKFTWKHLTELKIYKYARFILKEKKLSNPSSVSSRFAWSNKTIHPLRACHTPIPLEKCRLTCFSLNLKVGECEFGEWRLT